MIDKVVCVCVYIYIYIYIHTQCIEHKDVFLVKATRLLLLVFFIHILNKKYETNTPKVIF